MISILPQSRLSGHSREVSTRDGGIRVRICRVNGRDIASVKFGSFEIEFDTAQKPFSQRFCSASFLFGRDVRHNGEVDVEAWSFEARRSADSWVVVSCPIDPEKPAFLRASDPSVATSSFLKRRMWKTRDRMSIAAAAILLLLAFGMVLLFLNVLLN